MKYFKALIIYLLPVVPASRTVPANINHDAPTTDSLRVVLPVDIDYDDKIITPFVAITVNGKLLKAVFDTGSSGLRVTEGALALNASDTIRNRVTYSYGDNMHKLSLKGTVHDAEVSFGGLRSSSVIKIMCIDSAKYNLNSDWIAIGDSAVIKSNHFRGCSAILGVGLRKSQRLAGVVSPFSQLPGNGKFIVMLPGYGGTKGSVIINPSQSDEAGFTFFRLPPIKQTANGTSNGWLDDKLPGCIEINTTTECLPTLLDSGNPDIQVYSGDFSGNHPVPPNNYVTLRVGALKDTSFIETSFNVNNRRLTGKDYVYLDESDKEAKMVFGIGFFFRFDVLYDQQNGIIGIRKKSHKKGE